MWQRISSFLGRFAAERSGAVMLVFGIFLVPMLLGIGLAIDYSRALKTKQNLAQALDAAALAVGSWADLNEAKIKQKAQAFFDANYSSSNLGTPSSLNVVVQDGKITISATSDVDTTFMKMSGINQMSVGALTEVTLNEKKIELIMVLDNTGSMGWSGKLDALKVAANALVDVLMVADQNAAVDEDVKIGLAPFAAAVNIGADKLNSGWVDLLGQSSIADEDFQPGTNVLDPMDRFRIDPGTGAYAHARYHTIHKIHPQAAEIPCGRPILRPMNRTSIPITTATPPILVIAAAPTTTTLASAIPGNTPI
jgi:Flp pilus assembly protein TadG